MLKTIAFLTLTGLALVQGSGTRLRVGEKSEKYQHYKKRKFSSRQKREYERGFDYSTLGAAGSSLQRSQRLTNKQTNAANKEYTRRLNILWFWSTKVEARLTASEKRHNCVDDNTGCPGWSKTNQCNINPGWMHKNCKLSCGKC